MKLTLLFLMLPFLAFSAPSADNSSEVSIKPKNFKFGTRVETVSNFLNNKKTKLSNEVTSHNVKVSTINTGAAKLDDAVVISEKGVVKTLALVFNKANGEKFREDMIKQYGMPQAEMVDSFEWKSENIMFEIHETEAGFTATYQNADTEPLLAQF